MDVLIGEQIIKNVDDSYTILLNSRLSHERQLECYLHAINHMKSNSNIIELEAHNDKEEEFP